MEIDKNNPELLTYYSSLPKHIKDKLSASSARVSTLGELMLITEHYNLQQEVPNELQE